MVEWLWGWTRTHTGGAEWAAVVVLIVFIVTALVAIGVLWSRSRRWAVASRTQRLFLRNERSLRSEATETLGEALRSLLWARGFLRSRGSAEEADRLSGLLHRVEVVRDQRATGYTPGVVNTGEARFELDLGVVVASYDLRDEARALVHSLETGEAAADLTGLEAALERWTQRELVLR